MKSNKKIILHLTISLTLAQSLSAIDTLPHKKCHLEDSLCLKTQAQAVLNIFLQGIPQLGVKPLNKMHIDYIEVNDNDIHYELYDTVVTGLNSTIIDDISIYQDYKMMRIQFLTNLIANFNYTLDGYIFGIPVLGKGESEIKMNKLTVDLVIMYDIVKSENGKHIMDFKRFFVGADATDGVDYYFSNMSNGDKLKNDFVNSIMNKTWRVVITNYSRGFAKKIYDQIYDAVKIYMRSWPLEDLAIYTT